MSQAAQDMFKDARLAASSGENDTARRLFERALRYDPNPDLRADINFELSEICADPAEKRAHLEEALACDPYHVRARRSLAALDGKLAPSAVIDPDRIASRPAPPSASDPQRYVCPNCGGRMSYTPDGQSLICESCSSRERLGKGSGAGEKSAPEEDFIIAMATLRGHVRPESTRTIRCQSCGATYLLAPSALTLTCPYCGTAYVVDRAETRDLIAPGSLIPFGVDREAAGRAFSNRFQQASEGAFAMSGIYLPAWSFNLGGSVAWSCMVERGNSWIAETGTDYILEDRLLVAAGEKLKKLFPKAVKGFKPSGIVAYDPRYLADWPAETYAIPVADASLDARAEALARAREKIAAGIYQRSKDLVVRAPNLAASDFSLVLLPFWSAQRPGQLGQPVWMNGQTGEMITQPGGKTGSLLSRLLG